MAIVVLAGLLTIAGCEHPKPALTKDQTAEAKAVQMLQDAAPQLTVAREAMSKGATPAQLHIAVPVETTRCYRVAAHPEREPMMSAVAIHGCKVRSLARPVLRWKYPLDERCTRADGQRPGDERRTELKAIAVIPARIASTRLPRKPLREIAGKPMLGHVYEAARRATELAEVVVATDSEEIMALCRANGWNARMTSDKHKSGTDRVYEVAQQMPADVYVNVQGDEPLAHPEHISALLRPMQRAEVMVSTVMTPAQPEDIGNANAVKVVCDKTGRALYFSRATIPHDRDWTEEFRYMKHLGFYAYRLAALEKFCAWPESRLERSERLEQLRFLENGMEIHVEETPHDTIGVDTEDDLRRVERILLDRKK